MSEAMQIIYSVALTASDLMLCIGFLVFLGLVAMDDGL